MIRRQRRGGETLWLRRIWNGGRALVKCANTPQKEFKNFHPCSRRWNRSNKLLLTAMLPVPTRTEPWPPGSNPNFSTRGGWRRRCSPHLPRLPVERRLISSPLLQRFMFWRISFLFPLSYASMSPFIRRREVSRGAAEQHRQAVGSLPPPCWAHLW